MRLGVQKKDELKKQILNDLYDKKEKTLANQRKDFTRRNYEAHIAEAQDTIDKVPEGYINHSHTVSVDTTEAKVSGVNTVWEFAFDTYVPTLKKPGGYVNYVPYPIHPDLLDECKEIHQEMHGITTERDETRTYLKTTLDLVNTTKQLKNVWPEVLHKYIPVDAPRKTSKPVDIKPTIDAPVSTIQERMTENLLGG